MLKGIVMTTGEKIKHYRKQAGITQDQLAERAEIHPVSIRKYETNKMTPRWENVNKIAKVLGCSPKQLLDDKYCSVFENEYRIYIYNGECLCADDVLLRLSDEGRIALDCSDNNCYFIY